MSQIYVLHENDAWVEPLRAAFADLGLPYEEWFLGEGIVPFDQPPPDGVFYNRMSASSHTRGHRYGPELTHGVLNWLEAHGRRVVNSSRALYLEVSKLAQYAALSRAGIAVPRTAAATGRDNVLSAAKNFGPGPYILKPNRGGKGLGVRLFQSTDAIADYLDSQEAIDEAPIDGLWLIQEYLRAPQPFITRCEFVGGEFLYAVRVDTSGGFELCPADVCAIEGEVCPAGTPSKNIFTVLPDFQHPILDSYGRFLRANEIEVAGIEFIADEAGRIYTYDVNTNTNYNAQAEDEAGAAMTGMEAVARFLSKELTKTRAAASAVAAE